VTRRKSESGHAGEQARSRKQLHITAAQRAGGEGHGAGGEHSGRAGQRQADGDQGKVPSTQPPSAQTTKTPTIPRENGVRDLQRAQVLPGRQQQQQGEGEQTTGLKKR